MTPILITIVMPVRNEEKVLPRLLSEFEKQNFDPTRFEIIVADGGSTDRTRSIVETAAAVSPVNIRWLNNPGVGASSGRNVGILAARGEVIIFVDGHCHVPSRNLLQDTLALLQSTQADCLCRPQPLTAPQGSATGKVIAAVRASTLGHGRDSMIYDMTFSGFADPSSSGATYRREVFEKVGLYDERFDACEDVELNTRVRKAGLTAYSDPALAILYEPRTTLRLLYRQMVRYGRGRVRLMGKHPDTFSLTTLAPAMLMLLLLMTVLPWQVTRVTGLSIAAVYLVSVVAASVQLYRKHGLGYLWQGPPTYMAIHFGLGMGMLIEALSFKWWRLRRGPAGPNPGGSR